MELFLECLILEAAMLILFVGGFFIITGVIKKVKMRKKRLKVGDVIIHKGNIVNPFRNNEWAYETVIEVKTGLSGSQYFKSYASNKNGEKSNVQNISVEHSEFGKLYVSDDWCVVNHL